jgi:hypothetical protein
LKLNSNNKVDSMKIPTYDGLMKMSAAEWPLAVAGSTLAGAGIGAGIGALTGKDRARRALMGALIGGGVGLAGATPVSMAGAESQAKEDRGIARDRGEADAMRSLQDNPDALAALLKSIGAKGVY